VAHPARVPPAEVLLSAAPAHVVGLLLGTEEDWPRAFEAIAARASPFTYRGERHELSVERIVNEPFDLRYRPRYELVIDRLAWWYHLPREWLKKIALMDDVYLLNNPFTFQAMEKHSAYCAMMRLGFRIPETWLIPHKLPPGGGKWEQAEAKFEQVASRYNAQFDLAAVAERVGYPLFMKPFDGGQWVGVTRIAGPDELYARYDESGERLMHLQASVEDFDVFVRSLSIGAETMSMAYDPDRPLHDRYQVRHDFLSPQLGHEVVTFSRVVNAFFRWEFNSSETIVKEGVMYPIDYANASPDVALTSLHYYFPWALAALVRWTAFCVATRRPMRINQETRDYFAIGDRDDLSYEEKVDEYRRLADDYFGVAEYDDFCAEALPHLDDVVLEYVESDDFDALIVDTVRSTFPAHEHDHFVEHYRGLLGLWARDRRAAAPA
jgi:hypothetical protein